MGALPHMVAIRLREAFQLTVLLAGCRWPMVEPWGHLLAQHLKVDQLVPDRSAPAGLLQSSLQFARKAPTAAGFSSSVRSDSTRHHVTTSSGPTSQRPRRPLGHSVDAALQVRAQLQFAKKAQIRGVHFSHAREDNKVDVISSNGEMKSPGKAIAEFRHLPGRRQPDLPAIVSSRAQRGL